MTSTRAAAAVFFVFGTAGMAVMTSTETLWIGVVAAAVFVGSALMLLRSFWRLGDANRQEANQRFRAIGEALKEANRAIQQNARSLAVARGTVNETHRDSARALEQSAATAARLDAFGKGILEEVAQLQIDLATLDTTTTRFGTELKRGLERANKHRNRLVGQVDGIVSLYSVMAPSQPLPAFGGWAIAGDFARRYFATVLETKPHVVLEVGSGLSTLLCAKALEINGGDGQVYVLEHEEHWMQVTRRALEDHGVLHRAEILYAPLVETKIDSEQWMWYDLGAVDLPDRAEILLVDGPPQSTGELARYPALPLLLDRLTPDALIFLDDGIRPDETAVVERWVEEIPGLQVKRNNDAKESIEIRRTLS